MEIVVHIAVLFYEIFVVLFSWVLGTAVIKIFTLGQGRVGKFRFLSYNERKKWNDKVDGITGEELAIERRYANRTFNIGLATLFTPVLVVLSIIGYFNWK